MAKSAGRQKTKSGKVQKVKGQPKSCDVIVGSGACKKRKANALQKKTGICLNCIAG